MTATPPLRRAAFLDRDGVLNADHGYVGRVADFDWLPGVFDGLRRLAAHGYALVVVTNQSGIARGLYTEDDLAALTRHMQAELAAEGLALAGVYHCPHHPQAVLERYRRRCDCRKPAGGLIRRAADELGLDLAASLLIGDRGRDVAAGRDAGVGRCYLVGDDPGDDLDGTLRADGRFRDLAECARAVCAAQLPRAPSHGAVSA